MPKIMCRIAPALAILATLTNVAQADTPIFRYMLHEGISATGGNTGPGNVSVVSFSIPAITGADPITLVTSAAFTPQNLPGAVAVTVTGQGNPQISVAGGPWATSGTVAVGQSLEVELTTSHPGQTSTATVDIGGTAGKFAVTTIPAITDPAPFSIAAVTLEPTSTWVTSDQVALTGFNMPIVISVNNGAYISVDGGMWTTSGTILSGHYFQVQMLTTSAQATAASVTVTAGGVSATWSVTTENTTPTAFTIPAETEVVAPSMGATSSSPVTLTGFDTTTAISVSGTSGSPQISLDGGRTWVTSGTIQPGGQFIARMTSPPVGLVTWTATVTAGGISAPWSVTSAAFGTLSYTIPNMSMGATITAISPTVVGVGSSPVYAVSSGSLPNGLFLNSSTGAISGTPTAAGSYSFAITASNGSQTAISNTYSGTVVGATLFWTNRYGFTLSNLSTIYDYSINDFDIFNANTTGLGGQVTYSLVSGTMPPGLTIAQTDGYVYDAFYRKNFYAYAGTVYVSNTNYDTLTATGTYTYTIQARDSNGGIATAIVTTVVCNCSLQ